MNERVRRLLIGTSAIALVASMSALVALRWGRPLYYTDGARQLAAGELVDAPMVVWERPEPEAEIPGPVLGRVQALPDGRLLYGQLMLAGTADLVLFDPRRPALPPEPVRALNTRGHDLAPALADDGTLYFASDRTGGAGGFDLYRSRYEGGTFGRATRLSDWINGPLDEADPAPDPRGGRIVFVRRDPGVADGHNGTLMIGALEEEIAAIPLYTAERSPAPLDREPAFAPDGASLWFSRERADLPATVMRAWRLGDEFAPPIALEHWGGGAFRAPAPSVEGLSVQLLGNARGDDAEARGMVYRARGREVFPWWRGQADIELALLSFAILCAALLLLLVLGRVWRQLDVVTWCLLLSLLLHLLVLLWLTDVEIVRRSRPAPPTEGRFEVELLAADGSGADDNELTGPAAAELGPQGDLQFGGIQRELTAAAPAGGVADASPRMPDAGAPQESGLPDAAELAAAAEVSDAAEFALRSGTDAHAELVSASPAVTADAGMRQHAARTAAAAAPIAVTMPGAALLPLAVARETGAATEAIGNAELAPRVVAEDVAELGDAPALAAPKSTPDDLMAVASAAGAAATRGAEVAAGAPARAARAPAEPGAGSAVPEATDLGRAGVPVAAADSAATALPVGTDAAPVATLVDPVQLAPASTLGFDIAAPLLAAATPAAAPVPVAVGARRDAAAGTASSPSPTIERPDAELGLAARAVPDAVAAAASETERRMRVAPSALADAPAVAAAPPTPAAEVAPALAPLATAALVPASASDGSAAAGVVSSRASAALPSAAVEAPTPELARATSRGPGASRRLTASLATHREVRPEVALRDVWLETRFDAPSATGKTATPIGPVGLAMPAAPTSAPPSALPSPGGAKPAAGGELPRPASMLERARHRVAPTSDTVAEAHGELFRNRFGVLKTAALEQYGGTVETERAVSKGLAYLAQIQNRSGSWGPEPHRDDKYGEVFVGKTALCTLAFLGAGHTPKSDTPYSEVVRRAVRRLIECQDPDSGHFGVTSAYSHGISTYALAECYGMTHDESLREPVDLALQWILANQNRSKDPRSRGGWGYFSAELAAEDRFARTSVTAWMVMALESAKLSGFEIPQRALDEARNYIVKSWDENGRYFRYNHKPDRLLSDWPTLPASTPASVFALILLGHDKDDPRLRAALDYTLQRKPTRYARASTDDFVRRARGNVYFWYYGSLACFLAGGQPWQEWNEALKAVLPSAQNEDGSFEPIDDYARIARDNEQDKSYTTAMCVLSLEVYYRYFTPLLERQ